jgi:DNA mismatch endonuclease, patch repair protein
MPKSRDTYWREKFEGNVARDARAAAALEALGWRVSVIWECEARTLESLESALRSVMTAPSS